MHTKNNICAQTFERLQESVVYYPSRDGRQSGNVSSGEEGGRTD